MSLSFRSFGIFHRYRTDLVSTKFNRAGPALIPVTVGTAGVNLFQKAAKQNGEGGTHIVYLY